MRTVQEEEERQAIRRHGWEWLQDIAGCDSVHTCVVPIVIVCQREGVLCVLHTWLMLSIMCIRRRSSFRKKDRVEK